MNIDDESQYFAAPRNNYHSVTEPSANNNVYDQLQLKSYSLQHPINVATNMTYQKLLPPAVEVPPQMI